MFTVIFHEIAMKSKSVPIAYHHRIVARNDKNEKIYGLFIPYGVATHTKQFNCEVYEFDKVLSILKSIQPDFKIEYKHNKKVITYNEYKELCRGMKQTEKSTLPT